ncbi:hypothetical protein FF100_11025 [Methylobacterium terricola]|uniref:Uncharacterized protein n=1 Tax=Methylobacterium terricola TaxID=2583531 RepID=A0A5C4LJV5_9HYPH|nr:hypothetical protein [Methylobacterium terricola]TNC13341.1 hypothetical protein FF100_11025 [Methylobacterium terricola]
MSLRTNLTLAAIAGLGFATICAVCSAQLDRDPPQPQLVAVAKPPVPLDEPVVTGSIVPAPPAAKVARLAKVDPKPEPKKEAKKPKPEPALDSERLAALLAEPTVMKPKR